MRAAVLRSPDQPLTVEDVTLREPGPGQVHVRLAAAGVCHSDLSLARGRLLQNVPAVLGHEGAGTVLAVGDGVTRVAAGDTVVLNWSPSCRRCWFCASGEPWLCEHSADASASPYGLLGGEPVYAALGTAAFAEETVVPERGVVRLPAEAAVPLEQAALLGCALLTGVGAVVNTAGVQPGESVLVLGLGGVGLSAVQGARLAGAGQVIVTDRATGKFDLARQLGATDALEPGPTFGKQVRALTAGRGVDHAVDCVGLSETIRAAFGACRRGGTLTLVGIGGRQESVTFGTVELFHFARTIRGCVFGSTDSDRDIPWLLEHVRAGRLDVAALITRRIGLGDVESAFTDMEAGRGARSLVLFD